jgi:hypothetical protein
MSIAQARRDSGARPSIEGARTMSRNEGTVDRVVRIVLGLALLSLVFVGPKSWLGFLGIIPLVTGIVGTCPLYTLFGLSTCRAGSHR